MLRENLRDIVVTAGRSGAQRISSFEPAQQFSIEVSLIVARRRREIGIRIALGAERMDVLRLILGHVVRMTGVGLCLGLAGGLIAGRVLQSRLHGVNPAEPWNLAVGATILSAAALIAGFIPCWLSSRTDATQSLRAE